MTEPKLSLTQGEAEHLLDVIDHWIEGTEAAIKESTVDRAIDNMEELLALMDTYREDIETMKRIREKVAACL